MSLGRPYIPKHVRNSYHIIILGAHHQMYGKGIHTHSLELDIWIFLGRIPAGVDKQTAGQLNNGILVHLRYFPMPIGIERRDK